MFEIYGDSPQPLYIFTDSFSFFLHCLHNVYVTFMTSRTGPAILWGSVGGQRRRLWLVGRCMENILLPIPSPGWVCLRLFACGGGSVSLPLWGMVPPPSRCVRLSSPVS